jgi:hypothetical protein
MEDFEVILQEFPCGEFIQLLPEFQADSMVIIHSFNINDEIGHLFSDLFEKNFHRWRINNFRGSITTQMEQNCSETSCTFTYIAYLASDIYKDAI